MTADTDATDMTSEPAAQPAAAAKLPVTVESIWRLLPHRYPFLLIDRVIEFEPGKRVLAYKNVTSNEQFFQGHFPERPVMPGVLVVEALAQAGGALLQLSKGESGDGRIFYLAKILEATFRRTVVPGDRLELEVEITRRRGAMVQYSGTARVDGHEAASAQFLCAEAKD